MPRDPTGEERDSLRLLTCGSVDDGKSTLIGRLLLDSGAVFDDQVAALTEDSRRYGTAGDDLDPALLLDGLEDERQQGITIDVAYRYFSTEKRSFVVADTPGHEQYTRNMASGASNAELAVILVDARKGVLPQTRRHSVICSLLGIRHVVLAVNKIDLVGYDEAVFDAIAAAYRQFAAALGFASLVPIPISARFSDNVTSRSARTPWYRGPALLEQLETVDVSSVTLALPFRFPVQWVNRPNADFRGFSGTVTSGAIGIGDELAVAASGRLSRLRDIVTFDGSRDEAAAGDAVTLVLADDVDVTRGDLLCRSTERPEVADQFAAQVVWFSEAPLLPGRSYLLKIGGRTVPATVTALRHRLDVATLEHFAAATLGHNEIGLCNMSTSVPVGFDAYKDNRTTGGFILIDRLTQDTVGAGMIAHALRRAHNIHRQAITIGKAERAWLKRQAPAILWLTGLSGAGKSTIADHVEQALHAQGFHTTLLDGDNVRHGLNRDLGFTEVDRVENIRRVGEVARLMSESGLIVICSFISPFRAERQMVRELVEPGEFIEVFVDTPIEECRRRDPKGLYARADAGQIVNFTGVDSPYEPPSDPEVRIVTSQITPQEGAKQVIAYLREQRVIDR